MIAVIYPEDPSISFLDPVPESLLASLGSENFQLIRVPASTDGYRDAREEISALGQGSLVLYLGHGTSRELYGGASECFDRKPLYRFDDMSHFKDSKVIFFSCQSRRLINSSRARAGFSGAVGFGMLPSDMNEVWATAGVKSLDITPEILERYKSELVNILVDALKHAPELAGNLEAFHSYFLLYLNKRINALALSGEESVLANFLFFVKQDFVCY